MTDDNVILKERLKAIRDIKGNISINKLKMGDLIDVLISETSFLNEFDPSPSERIYCVENDISEILRCPITNDRLKYSPVKKRYLPTRKFAHKHRKRPPREVFKKSFKNSSELIFKTYNNNEYNILPRDECLKIFELLTPQKMSRISSRIGKNNMDFTCSMIFHTKFLGEDDLKMSERYYCIKNNIVELVVDERNRPLKYINRYVGYSVYPNKSVIYEDYKENATEEIEKKFKIIDLIKTEGKGQINRIELQCNDCDYQFSRLFKNALWKKLFCPQCLGFNQRSKAEDEIVEFLKEQGVSEIVLNDRNILDGYEIDIFLPEYNIGIEYCGIIWHSFGTTFPNNIENEKYGKHKHLNKLNICKDKKISLITIFENEWLLKKDIVKSIILNKIGKSYNRVFARKCEFKEVDKKVSREFLDDNHIQGSSSFSDSYGLFYNNELVSLMCFGKRKITRGVVKYELIRFCNKLGYSVVGGASKLLKNSKVDECISYCDLRYSGGNLYGKLGMKLSHQSKPNYFYTKNNMDLLHRSNFQKHKIIDKPTKLTETEIMYERGYRKIYDCGNLVFEYKKENSYLHTK